MLAPTGEGDPHEVESVREETLWTQVHSFPVGDPIEAGSCRARSRSITGRKDLGFPWEVPEGASQGSLEKVLGIPEKNPEGSLEKGPGSP